MKNYKFLVPILLVALLGGSVYKTYSDREKINKQYDNDIFRCFYKDRMQQSYKIHMPKNCDQLLGSSIFIHASFLSVLLYSKIEMPTLCLAWHIPL